MITTFGFLSLDGYQILACDGSHIVYATDLKNRDDYVKPRKEGDNGYKQLHLNALYDIINRTYIDAVIQPGVKMNEHAALRFMLEHFEPSDPAHVILTVDRGCGSYNLIVQLHIFIYFFMNWLFTSDMKIHKKTLL